MFWRNEMKVNRFSLNYDKPVDFLRAQVSESRKRANNKSSVIYI